MASFAWRARRTVRGEVILMPQVTPTDQLKPSWPRSANWISNRRFIWFLLTKTAYVINMVQGLRLRVHVLFGLSERLGSKKEMRT